MNGFLLEAPVSCTNNSDSNNSANNHFSSAHIAHRHARTHKLYTVVCLTRRFSALQYLFRKWRKMYVLKVVSQAFYRHHSKAFLAQLKLFTFSSLKPRADYKRSVLYHSSRSAEAVWKMFKSYLVRRKEHRVLERNMTSLSIQSKTSRAITAWKSFALSSSLSSSTLARVERNVRLKALQVSFKKLLHAAYYRQQYICTQKSFSQSILHKGVQAILKWKTASHQFHKMLLYSSRHFRSFKLKESLILFLRHTNFRIHQSTLLLDVDNHFSTVGKRKFLSVLRRYTTNGSLLHMKATQIAAFQRSKSRSTVFFYRMRRRLDTLRLQTSRNHRHLQVYATWRNYVKAVLKKTEYFPPPLSSSPIYSFADFVRCKKALASLSVFASRRHRNHILKLGTDKVSDQPYGIRRAFRRLSKWKTERQSRKDKRRATLGSLASASSFFHTLWNRILARQQLCSLSTSPPLEDFKLRYAFCTIKCFVSARKTHRSDFDKGLRFHSFLVYSSSLHKLQNYSRSRRILQSYNTYISLYSLRKLKKFAEKKQFRRSPVALYNLKFVFRRLRDLVKSPPSRPAPMGFIRRRSCLRRLHHVAKSRFETRRKLYKAHARRLLDAFQLRLLRSHSVYKAEAYFSFTRLRLHWRALIVHCKRQKEERNRGTLINDFKLRAAFRSFKRYQYP